MSDKVTILFGVVVMAISRRLSRGKARFPGEDDDFATLTVAVEVERHSWIPLNVRQARGDPATDLAALIGPASYGESFADWLASAYPALAAELPRAHFYLGTFALQDALFGLETRDAEAFEAGIADYR